MTRDELDKVQQTDPFSTWVEWKTFGILYSYNFEGQISSWKW